MKHNNACGVKGKSGRKTAKEENGRLQILDKAWWIVKEWIEDLEVPIKERRTVALELVKKSVPQNIDLTSKGKVLPTPIIQLNALHSDLGNKQSNSTEE